MSIIIKGMKMPEEGGLKVLCVYGDGSIRMPVWGKGLVKAEYMQASELPPHGRLIDADKLKRHIDKLPALPDGNFAGTHRNLKALINMQKAVIEAEGSDG